MPFHGRIQLGAPCANSKVKLPIQSKNPEKITVRARRRTRPAITELAKVVSSLHPARRTAFANCICPRRNVPDHPMGKHSARRVCVINNEGQTFGSRRHRSDLQRRVDISAVACEFCRYICALAKSRAGDLYSGASCAERNRCQRHGHPAGYNPFSHFSTTNLKSPYMHRQTILFRQHEQKRT